eukprot:scaffold66083_cov26-Phaeocystis_antarctica.AAC.2
MARITGAGLSLRTTIQAVPATYHIVARSLQERRISTPNAWCVAPPPRPSGVLLPGAEVVQAAAGK